MAFSHLLLAALIGCLLEQGSGAAVDGRTSTAARHVAVAVYEHVTTVPSVPPVQGEERNVTGSNLAQYARMAQTAAEQGAKLIVFPEDGVYGTRFTRDSIKPYLEEIPDPQKTEANPCLESRYESLFIQRALSCMARNFSIYVVANVGDRVPCSKVTDSRCPEDKQYQYNTNVAYDPTGKLVAKYHKRNLFYEFQFDQPEVEYSVFDTEFGRVGTMTCFDVLFKEPAVGLVEKYGIQYMAFPTAWGNAWPHLYSIQFHQAFAIRMGVNFLESGFHRPERMTGSGVYAGADKAKNVYFNSSHGSSGGLVIANSTNAPRKPSKTSIPPINLLANAEEFTGAVHRDINIMVELKGLEGNLTVSSKNVTCALSFKRKATSSAELYILGAFDGLHFSSLNWYIQSCVLLKCANTSRASCGAKTLYANTVFDKFQLTGQFNTEYVFPSVMSNDTNMPNSNWEYFIGEEDPRRVMIRSEAMTQPFVTASLYGRLYAADGNEESGAIIAKMTWKIIWLSVTFSMFLLRN